MAWRLLPLPSLLPILLATAAWFASADAGAQEAPAAIPPEPPQFMPSAPPSSPTPASPSPPPAPTVPVSLEDQEEAALDAAEAELAAQKSEEEEDYGSPEEQSLRDFYEEEIIFQPETQKRPSVPPPGAAAPRDASPAPLAPGKTLPTSAPKQRPFIKGDLIHVGTRTLLSRYDHVGLRLGGSVIDSQLFAVADPGFAIYYPWGAFALHAPLNLRVMTLEGVKPKFGGMLIRKEDWNSRSDYARVVRFLSIGRKEDNFYLTINSLRPTTLGYGMLMRDYQGNIDIDRFMTALVFDAYNDYGGFQLHLNDITLENQILGGLAFVKPLATLKNPILRSLSIGVEYMGDMRAPLCVAYGDGNSQCVPGVGHSAGFDPYTHALLDNTFVRTDRDTGRYVAREGRVDAAGISSELKILKDTNTYDVKLFNTHHKFLNSGGGWGSSYGVLGRFNIGDTYIHALRVNAEYRLFNDGFLPEYFNTVYEINKYEYHPGTRAAQITPTKYQAIFGDPKNGFARSTYGRRSGYRADLSYGLFRQHRGGKKIAAGLGIADSARPQDSNFYAHVEYPALRWMQVFASYFRFNAASMADVFKSAGLGNDDTIILAGARFRLASFIFLNASYARNYRVVRSAGSEYHLGNSNIVDVSGNTGTFKQARLFENTNTLMIDLEVGYEFDSEKP